MSLRDKKRRATLNAIYDAATSLVVDRGFENVTVEDICQKAGVSRRTFFNYVDSKESAVLSEPPRAVSEEEEAEFLSTMHDDFISAVIVLAANAYGLTAIHPRGASDEEAATAAKLLRRRKLILAKNPDLSAHRLVARYQSLTSMIDTTCAYLARYPKARTLACPIREEARAVVMMATAAIQLGYHAWMDNEGDTSITSLFDQFDVSLSHLIDLARARSCPAAIPLAERAQLTG